MPLSRILFNYVGRALHDGVTLISFLRSIPHGFPHILLTCLKKKSSLHFHVVTSPDPLSPSSL